MWPPTTRATSDSKAVLEWSGQRERDDPPITTLRVPPGLQRHIDLLQITPRHPSRRTCLRQQRSRSAADQPVVDARLCVHPKPWGAGHRIPATGDHDVVLTVIAANADSVTYKMTVSHNGTLSADLVGKPKRMSRQGLFVLLKCTLKLAFAGFRTSKV